MEIIQAVFVGFRFDNVLVVSASAQLNPGVDLALGYLVVGQIVKSYVTVHSTAT
jgi:hypothetical protein